MYNITLLRTAHIDCADSVLYKNGDSASATKIGCHCFLLEKDGKYFLIDTGIEDMATVNKTKSSKADWLRGDGEYNVKENLEKLGVNPADISKVFVTHAHYDHISGAIHFENAKFYMTNTEYELLYSPDNNLKEFLSPVKDFLTGKRVVLFDDELETDGIRLKKRGGHTAGSMSVEVDGILFTGDTLFVQDNINKKIPAGFTADRETSDRLLEEYLAFDGRIITSHDFNEVI